MTYYNTVRETGKTLAKYTKKADTQEKIILGYFRKNPGKGFTPEKIRFYLFGPNTPITSVRRAMTTLSKKGLLRKTSAKKKGNYNRNCSCWELSEET